MALLVDFAAGEVQDLGGDLLLAGFVVDEGEFGEEVFAVVGCGLHGNGSRRVLRSRTVQEGRVEFEFERLREQRLQHFRGRWLHDVIFVHRFLDFAFGFARNDRGGFARNDRGGASLVISTKVLAVIVISTKRSARRDLSRRQELLRHGHLLGGGNEMAVHQHNTRDAAFLEVFGKAAD